MIIPFDRLKSSYRSYIRALEPSSRRNCPPTADLLRFFSIRASRRFKSRVLNHIAGCASCADEFLIIMDMDRATRKFSEEAARLQSADSGKSRKFPGGFLAVDYWPIIGAGIASVLLGFLLITRVQPGPPEETEVFRSADDLQVLLIEPVGPIEPNQAIFFRWRCSGGKLNRRCVLSLFDDSLQTVWMSPPTDIPCVFLPQVVQVSLVPRRSYYWMVEIVEDAEWSTVESDLESFTIDQRKTKP